MSAPTSPRRYELPESDFHVVAKSEAMKSVIAQLEPLIVSNCPVVVEGERGSGREIIAKLLLRERATKNTRFLSLGAGAGEVLKIPRGQKLALLIRDLFDLGQSEQESLAASLARSSRRIQSIVAVCDPGLQAAVNAGMFSKTLHARVAGATLAVPALRDRTADIVPLAKRFISAMGKEVGRKRMTLSARATTALEQYPWPGNVAELKHVARRLVIGAKRSCIGAHDVDGVLTPIAARVPAEQLGVDDLIQRHLRSLLEKVGDYPVRSLHSDVLALVERPLIQLVLEHTGKNQLKSSQMLGMSRNTLRRKMEDYGVGSKRLPAKRASSKPAARAARSAKS